MTLINKMKFSGPQPFFTQNRMKVSAKRKNGGERKGERENTKEKGAGEE